MFVYDHTPTVTLTDRRRSDPVDDNYISAAKHDQQRRNSAAMAALPKTVAVVPLQTSPLSQSARGSQKMDPFKSSDEPEDPSLLDPESDASPGQSSEPLLYGSSSVDPDQMLSTIDHDLERAVEALSDLWQDESNSRSAVEHTMRHDFS